MYRGLITFVKSRQKYINTVHMRTPSLVALQYVDNAVDDNGQYEYVWQHPLLHLSENIRIAYVQQQQVRIWSYVCPYRQLC